MGSKPAPRRGDLFEAGVLGAAMLALGQDLHAADVDIFPGFVFEKQGSGSRLIVRGSGSRVSA